MFNWIYPTKSDNLTPKKLIQIKDNKLILDGFDIPTDTEISIFSIIGTARTGKSTLLNCIGSYLLKKNVKIFNIDDTDEHCTIGIDMYYFEMEKIVLLDCQGLKLDDSSNDPKLLLIVYLISDCIIYNQRSILNNDIFETLQPLATFINYIENINYKPNLIFRILDSELKYEPKKLLEKTLSNKNDQYQNTREAMLNLFSTIEICITNSLDRNEKKLLQQHKFYDFMTNDENNFMNCIKNLLKYRNENKKFSEWYKIIKNFITSINTNKKIDFNKLDIYQICVEKEILEFKLAINQDNYKDISCGILDEDYLKIVVPKIEYKDNILRLFHSKFNMAGKKMYHYHYEEIKNKLEMPILHIEKSIIERARKQIKNELNIYFKNDIKFAFNSLNKNTTLDDYNEKYDIIIYKLNDFLQSINKYYSFVVDEYKKIIEVYKLNIKEKFFELVEIQNKNFNNIVEYFDIINNKYDNIYDIILKYNFKDYHTNKIHVNYDSFMDDIKQIIFCNILKNEIDYNKFLNYFILNKNNNFKEDIFIEVKKTIDDTIPKNKLYEDFLKYELLTLNVKNVEIEIKSKNYITYTLSPSKIYIDQKFDLLKDKIFTDDKLHKIINTKIMQNNIFYFHKTYSIDTLFFDKISKYINLPIINNKIDKNVLRRSLLLDEFKKYLIKKYRKNISLNKQVVIKSLLDMEPNMINIYKQFLMDRNVLSNKVLGININ